MPPGPLSVREHGPGSAPTVVLLHGLGTTGWMWERLVAATDGGLHLLVVALPWHGASNRRAWVSLAETVSAVADVVTTRAHGGRAHVIGLSLGGAWPRPWPPAVPTSWPAPWSAG